MSKFFPSIYKNEATRQRLAESIADGSILHAYIIEGESGSGRMTLAMNIAMALACKSETDIPCERCDTCRRIMSSGSPDVRIFDSEGKATIGVETVRKLKQQVYLSASENDYKVFIIKDSHTMTPQAQNALLKVLEEPPKRVVIILVCNDSATLLTTVRSRAQTIHMQCLTGEELEEYLTDKSSEAKILRAKEPERFKALVMQSGGRIGKALELLNSKRLSEVVERRAVVDRVISAVCGKSYSALYDALTLLSSKREDAQRDFLMLGSAIRDLVLIKKHKDCELLYYHDRNQARSLASKMTLSYIFSVNDIISESAVMLTQNTNISSLIVSIVSDIKKIQR